MERISTENKLKKIQQIAEVGIWELDLIGNKLAWSDEIYRIFNLEPQDFKATYEAFLSFIHPDDRDKVDKAYKNSIKEKKDYDIEHRVVCNDGELKYVHERCEHIYNERGEIVYSIGTIQNITKNTKAKKETEYLQNQLLTILENLNAGIFVVSKDDKKIIYANKYLHELYNTNIIGNKCIDFFGNDDKCESCLVFSDEREEAFEYELPGSNKWFLSRQKAIKWADGKDVIIHVLNDITPLKENEKLRDEIDKIVRHDLKNPLNGILGISQIMLEEKKFDEEYMQLVRDSGQKMLDMINKSLDLYKMEKGIYELSSQIIDIESLIKSAVKSFSLQADRNDVDILLNVDIKHSLLGEELLFYSIFSNLIKNAIEASQHDVVSINIDDDDENIIINFWNKREIPQEIKNNFGEKYTTFGKPYGTGLGIYSVKLMTKIQNGIFDWSSDEKGTTIKLKFPIKEM